MPLFEYRAIQPDGTIAEGRLEAGGRPEAFRQLEGRGLNPVSLNEHANGQTDDRRGFQLRRRSRRVPFRALEAFTRQLSSLLAAGVPLSRALKLLGKEAATAAAADKWKEIHELVIDGTSLADAMKQSPDTFPGVYTAMVHAGETGGFLDVVLGQIADFQMREKELRAKVFSALIYPAVLAVLAIAVLIFLLVFFIPRFQAIFADFDAALPTLTLLIVGASDVLTRYGPFIAIALVAFVTLLVKWLQTDRGRVVWERFVLSLPVIGSLNARFARTRFCRMFGTLVGAGVPMISALRVARESIGNQTLTDAVGNSIERVKQGDGLAASLADCPVLFPGSVLEMISVAEETGRLDQELVRMAGVTEQDLDRQLKTAVSLAEPIMLFLMAGFIGTIFVGMVIPIFTIQDYIK